MQFGEVLKEIFEGRLGHLQESRLMIYSRLNIQAERMAIKAAMKAL